MLSLDRSTPNTGRQERLPVIAAAVAVAAALLLALPGCTSTAPTAPTASTAVNPLALLNPVANLPADPEFAAKVGHKAQAVSRRGEDRYVASASNQATAASAAMTALQRCWSARAERADPTEDACELIRSNDAQLRTGAALRAHVPTTRHPLFLWQVEKAGKTGYLAGSIHLLKETLLPPPTPLLDAFARSERLVLELDTSSITPEQLAAARARHGELPQEQTLWQLLDAPQRAITESFLRQRGVPPARVANLKPAMLALEVAVVEYIALGYLPQFGLENYFQARLGNRPLLGLETVDEQLAAATALPLDLQADVLLDAIAESAEMSASLDAMVVAWLSGDDATFTALVDEQNGSVAAEKWLDELLIKRNQTMASRLDALLLEPGSPFVLIGAAHLLGSGSVVDLLAERGFAIERLYSDHRFD